MGKAPKNAPTPDDDATPAPDREASSAAPKTSTSDATERAEAVSPIAQTADAPARQIVDSTTAADHETATVADQSDKDERQEARFQTLDKGDVSGGLLAKKPTATDAVAPSSNPTLVTGAQKVRTRSRSVNYSLRPAKNIERKMMAEAFMRLAPIAPLSTFRYVGMGSEFFNDFALFHQSLGVLQMISIERDADRIERCTFNRPYQCIDVRYGSVGEVLPTLGWTERSIVWLDYTGKLDEAVLSDVSLVVSQATSGSLLVWSVNADPWGTDANDFATEAMPASRLPELRMKRLEDSVGRKRVRRGVKGSDLAKWGLAAEYHSIITNEIVQTLNDRNAAADEADRLRYQQCFHFRYRDGARMLTVGGLLLNAEDAERLGSTPFAELFFVRPESDAFEIAPPMLTSREIRHLNRRMPPHVTDDPQDLSWLLQDSELSHFRELYRYYPVFAESEL